MNRKQRRANGIKHGSIEPTYNMTIDQMKDMMEDATNKALNQSLLLMLVLPMEVLMDNYWKKTYRKKIPEFTQHVLDYYKEWQEGKLDIEELRKDLWEFGGVRLELEKGDFI